MPASTRGLLGGRPRAGFAAVLALALAGGASIRLLGLDHQVMIGDERWDLLVAARLPLSEILTGFTYARSSYSPPLAAGFRLLSDLGVPLSEWVLRAPALLCGLLAIPVLPLATRRWIGGSAAGLFAVLLALSPALVWYSRLVRAYMPVVLLANAAALAFLWWHETRSRRAGALYVALAAISSYLHPLSVPFVLAPLVHLGVELLTRRRREAAAWRRGIGMAGAVLAAMALLLLPALESLDWLASRTSTSVRPGPETLGLAALRIAGSYSVPVAVLFFGVALRGLWILWREARSFAAFGAILVAAQTTSVLLVIVPPGLAEPVLLVRYVLVVQPLLLAWVAVGLSRPWSSAGESASRLQGVAVAAALAALFFTGPLATPELRQSSFAHMALHRHWGTTPALPTSLPSTAFYASLHGERSGPVVECSWQDVAFQHTAPTYQRIHGNPVLVASPLDAWWSHPRIALRNAVGTSPPALIESPGRHVVVHLRPVEEEWEARGRDRTYKGLLAIAGDFARNYEAAQRQLATRLESAWGAPDHADAWIRAWDLERVRSGRTRPSRSSGDAEGS